MVVKVVLVGEEAVVAVVALKLEVPVFDGLVALVIVVAVVVLVVVLVAGEEEEAVEGSISQRLPE